MRRFLTALAETGHVPVPDRAIAAAAEVECDDLLAAADAAARLAAPVAAPPFDLAAARRAARWLFRACVCLADRTVDADDVRGLLGGLEEAPPTAAAHWSVDVFLRHVPQLHTLVRAAAPADPLVGEIERVGVAWPLSGVGLPHPPDVAAPPACIAADPCLRRLYVDRVLRSDATDRVAVPWVAEAVRSALGGHPEVAPAMARAVGVREGVSDES